jgi:hypothetical protein
LEEKLLSFSKLESTWVLDLLLELHLVSDPFSLGFINVTSSIFSLSWDSIDEQCRGSDVTLDSSVVAIVA